MQEEVPEEFFKSVLKIRLMEMLQVIKEQQSEVGTSIYQLTVENLVENINNRLQKRSIDVISERTLYRYLRQAQREGWLRKISQIVKMYRAISLDPPKIGRLPSFFIVDENGGEIPPDACPQQIFGEIGEKTLTSYQLTEMGHKILEIYQNQNSVIGESKK
ncbi:MAG: hypothetical protein ACFFCZ_27210 [Promethearchaeota archaeon]